MRFRFHGLASFVLLAGMLPGCARTPTSTPTTPQPARKPVDDITTMERELDARELELSELGVELPLGELDAPMTDAPDAAGGPSPSARDDAAAESEAPSPDGSPTPSEAKKTTNTRAERSRCQRICDLARSTCELAESICALAAHHADEPRYRDACSRGEDQCRAATGACGSCRDD